MINGDARYADSASIIASSFFKTSRQHDADDHHCALGDLFRRWQCLHIAVQSDFPPEVVQKRSTT